MQNQMENRENRKPFKDESSTAPSPFSSTSPPPPPPRPDEALGAGGNRGGPRRKDQGILTVVEQVSYQKPGGVPIVSVTRHSVTKDGDATSYAAPPIDVGPMWVRVDLAWLAEAPNALVTLANHEGVRFSRIPTPEEATRVLARIVDVYLSPGDPPAPETIPLLAVPTADSVRLRLPKGISLWVRCLEARDKPARVSYTVFP